MLTILFIVLVFAAALAVVFFVTREPGAGDAGGSGASDAEHEDGPGDVRPH